MIYPLKWIIQKAKINGSYKNSVSFPYDDVTVTTATNTEPCDSSVTSIGNASLDALEVYQLKTDELEINYRGPKILSKKETPLTICTANIIGLVRSSKLLRVLLDSNSNACLIKWSTLLKGITPKD